MRTSIIAGLTLSAAVMAVVGQSHAHVIYPGCVAGDVRDADCRTNRDQCAVDAEKRASGSPCIQIAYDDPAKGPVIELASLKDSKSVKSVRSRRKQPNRVVETPGPQLLRTPAYPVIRDCTHVFFPQCNFRGDLNDGTFALPSY